MEHNNNCVGLCPLSFGTSAAILSILWVLLIALLAHLGYDKDTADMLAKHHLAYFSMTPVGVLTGVIAGGIHGFIFGFLFAWFYNFSCTCHAKNGKK